MVELAVALPFVLLMLAAIIQYGHIFYVQTQLDGAVRDAAMYAIYYPDSDSQIENVAREAMGGMSDSELTVTVSAESSARETGTSITVDLVYDVSSMAWAFLPSPGNLFSSMTVRIVDLGTASLPGGFSGGHGGGHEGGHGGGHEGGHGGGHEGGHGGGHEGGHGGGHGGGGHGGDGHGGDGGH